MRSKHKIQNLQPKVFPSVSVLKPLKGLEPGLDENLRSFFRLAEAYGNSLELLFCLESERDPAFRVLTQVAFDFQKCSARVYFSGRPAANQNPKVENLREIYSVAKNDWVFISDSTVRITPECYANFLATIDSEEVGMVTGIVRGIGPKTFGGELEAAILNTFYTKGMRLAEAAENPCVIGKAMLFRKSDLARMGGLNVLGNYLAEDYMAGVGLRHLGLKIKIADAPVDQFIGKYSLREFWKRHIRWGRIRKAQAPLLFLIEPMTQPLVLSIAGGWFASRFGYAAMSAGLIQFAVFVGIDLVMRLKFEGRLRVASIAASFVRELIAPIQWLNILCGREVDWRGTRLKVVSGGLLEQRRAL